MAKLHKNISIIGCGSWGVSIANHLSDKALVSIYHYRLDFLQKLKKNRLYNGSFSLEIPNNIKFIDSYDISSDLCIISTRTTDN